MHKKPLVSVVMITYGHEKYIEEAINGVLMQNCNFDIELILSNDCSPDGTDTIVKSIIKNHSKSCYIKYIKHETNLGMMPNFIFALKKSIGTYIALCDADDYWTDPLKLQKQVDFLETNEDYVACSHHRYILENNALIKQEFDKHIYTQCLLFKNILKETDYLFLQNVFNADSFLNLILETKGEIKFMDFYGAVYRSEGGGVYSSLTICAKNEKGLDSLKKMELYLKSITKSKKIEHLLQINTVHINAVVMSNCCVCITNSKFQQIRYFLKKYQLQSLPRYIKDFIKIVIN